MSIWKCQYARMEHHTSIWKCSFPNGSTIDSELPVSVSLMKKGQTISEFPTTGRTKSYFLDSVPLELWRSVQQKAQGEKRSIRYVVLSLLRDWAQPAEAKGVAVDEIWIRKIDGHYFLGIGESAHKLTQEQFQVHCRKVIDLCQAQILQRAS